MNILRSLEYTEVNVAREVYLAPANLLVTLFTDDLNDLSNFYNHVICY
jgi:hypothetical protein